MRNLQQMLCKSVHKKLNMAKDEVEGERKLLL